MPSPKAFEGYPINKILKYIKELLIGFPPGARGNDKMWWLFRYLYLESSEKSRSNILV